jgi:hypothetical protein
MTLLAIPHNSNASKGMMFPSADAEGNPMDLEYAQTREHFEPLIEMMQVKGNSEVYQTFWPEDEFADFENADSIQNFSGRTFRKGDFVREGLKKGLVFEKNWASIHSSMARSAARIIIMDYHPPLPKTAYRSTWRFGRVD